MKKCKKCHLTKLINEFHRNKYSKDGLKSHCKSCRKKYQADNKEHIKEYGKKYSENNKEKIALYREKYYQNNKEELLIDYKIYRSKNKIKKREKDKEYYINNKSKIISYQKAYAQDNKEKIREYKREYFQKNIDKIRENKNKYIKERIKKEPSYKLRIYVSRRIASGLKRSNSNKINNSCLKYLNLIQPNYINDLKYHLESLFEPWMTWDNHGKYNAKTWNDNDISTWTWNIDHIIPHSMFKYTSMEDDNFKQCWALKNLRPLSAKQNILDGTRKLRHNSSCIDKESK